MIRRTRILNTKGPEEDTVDEEDLPEFYDNSGFFFVGRTPAPQYYYHPAGETT